MKHLIETMKYTVPPFGHLCRTSIILLLAIFVLLLAGPADARESGEFHFLVDGGVSGEATRNNLIKKKNTTLWVSQPGMELDISHFKGLTFNEDRLGADCFPGDPDPDGKYTGPFVVSQERDGSAHVDFYFVANGTGGSPDDHKYVLHLFGTFDDPDNFPPAVETSIVMTAFSWMMSTEGRGQARKVTCTGTGQGTPEFAVVIVTRNP